MNGHRIVIGGELHLTLETVAECYRVDVAWMREVYDRGLIGRGVAHEQTIAIAARLLDRVAELVRLHHYHRIDPDAIELLLELQEE